jgi:hypothetical protein
VEVGGPVWPAARLEWMNTCPAAGAGMKVGRPAALTADRSMATGSTAGPKADDQTAAAGVANEISTTSASDVTSATAAAPTAGAAGEAEAAKAAKPQVFRSPVAAAMWWLWGLFAVGNLVDLAVQGRDHVSLVAAAILLVITGVVYATAQRPRIIAADDRVVVKNPMRDHSITWNTVAKLDVLDLIRFHCEWPEQPDRPAGKRVIYAWAIHMSRRRQMGQQIKAASRAKSGRSGGMLGTRGAYSTSSSTGYGTPAPPKPITNDAEQVLKTLNERLEQAHADGDWQAAARPPVSTWYWPSFAAILVPVVFLVIVAVV